MWPVCGWWHGPYRSYAEAKAAGAECGLKPQSLVWAGLKFLDWIIAGGESGPGARPMHPDWARSLRDQCAAASVSFHFKQWGAYVTPDQMPAGWDASEDPLCIHGADFTRLPKKVAGRLLDGVQHDGMPEVHCG